MEARIDACMRDYLRQTLSHGGHALDQIYTLYESIAQSALAYYEQPNQVGVSPEDIAFKKTLNYAAKYLLFDDRIIRILIGAAVTTTVFSSVRTQDEFENTKIELELEGYIIPEDPAEARTYVAHKTIERLANIALQYIDDPDNAPNIAGP